MVGKHSLRLGNAGDGLEVPRPATGLKLFGSQALGIHMTLRVVQDLRTEWESMDWTSLEPR